VPVAALLLRSTDLLKPPWERGLEEHDVERPPLRKHLNRRGRAFVAAGSIAVFLMWVPPVVQQLTHRPGNLGEVESYVRASHDRSPLPTASIALGTELRAFPFLKDTPHLYQESDTELFEGPRRTRFLPYIYMVAAGLLCALAVRRGDRLAATCAAIGGSAVLAGLVSALLVSPPLYPYLVAWMCVLPVPIWAAAAALVWRGIERRAASAGLGGRLKMAAVLAVVAVSAACVTQAVRDDQLKEHLAFPGGAESWRLVRTRVLTHRGPVLLYLADGGTMPVAASIANQAYRRGRTYHVNRTFLYMFGDAARSHGGETLELFFAGVHQTDDEPPPPKAVDLGIVRETHVYAVYR